MPTVYIAPLFQRDGVVAGFVLSRQETTVYTTTEETYVDEFGVEQTREVTTATVTALAAPAMTTGVLFAQGTMWRPNTAPGVPANGGPGPN
jgi:hypothetical protein